MAKTKGALFMVGIYINNYLVRPFCHAGMRLSLMCPFSVWSLGMEVELDISSHSLFIPLSQLNVFHLFIMLPKIKRVFLSSKWLLLAFKQTKDILAVFKNSCLRRKPSISIKLNEAKLWIVHVVYYKGEISIWRYTCTNQFIIKRRMFVISSVFEPFNISYQTYYKGN